jgi:hypothetical protein
MAYHLITREGKKGKMTADFGLPDIYKYYLSQVTIKPLSRAKFGDFIRELNEEIAKSILDKPQSITLPCHCGTLSVRKYRQGYNKKKMRVDWVKSKELGKRIYHLNEHRDGYKYFFKWERAFRTPNITAYSFLPSRELYRTLAKILKTDFSKDYMLRDSFKKQVFKQMMEHEANKPTNTGTPQ